MIETLILTLLAIILFCALDKVKSKDKSNAKRGINLPLLKGKTM